MHAGCVAGMRMWFVMQKLSVNIHRHTLANSNGLLRTVKIATVNSELIRYNSLREDAELLENESKAFFGHRASLP